MAEPGWFYHVAYQYNITNGQTYGDTTFTSQQRIATDEAYRQLREVITEELADSRARRSGVVITSITLLGRTPLAGPEASK